MTNTVKVTCPACGGSGVLASILWSVGCQLCKGAGTVTQTADPAWLRPAVERPVPVPVAVEQPADPKVVQFAQFAATRARKNASGQ